MKIYLAINEESIYGHRAGNYGIGVLKELENINCQGRKFNLLKEIDYFSTVSGGGLAAGVYISTLFDNKQKHENKGYSLRDIIDNDPDHIHIKRNLERGYHNILIKALVNLRSIGNNDRGDFLEQEFDEKLLGNTQRNKSLTLGDVFVPKTSVSNPVVPMWVANATVYENGSIFPFHPMGLEKYKITQYTHHLKKIDLGENYFSMPLSVGLKASASFPGAVPATTLTSRYDLRNEYLHLFDGGLSDNLGVNTAMKMLSSTGHNEKVLIVIDAYNGQPEPFSKQEGSPTALQIFLRSTEISLDAWRIHHKAFIEQLSSSNEFKGKKVKVIYLAFDGLPEQMKEKVSEIGTNFNISKAQQSTLFEAARIIVSDKKDELIRAVYGGNCSK